MALSIDTTARLRLEEIDAMARLEGLAGEWHELWQRCPAATPFQSPQWLLPWWRHLGEGALWVLGWRDEARLRALAPLAIVPGADGVRRVLALGTGISDILDALIEPGYEAHVAGELGARLWEGRARWDECDLHQLRPASPLLHLRVAPLRDEITEQEPCPTIALPRRPEELDACLSGKFLKKLRYYERRVRMAGEVEFQAADAASLGELIEAFLDLHSARWQAHGQSGVLAGEPIRNFHSEAAAGLLAAGALRLYALRANGRIRGVIHTLLHRGRAYAYLCGYDPADERFSPGALLVRHAIREAVRAGATEFDFLRGREDYKYRWGAGDRVMYRRRVWVET